MNLPPYLDQDKDGACFLRLWIQPKASRSGFAGLHGNRLKIRVAAPPTDNRANQELIRFLAKALGLTKSQVELVAGNSSRGKTVRVEELKAAEILGLLPES